MQRGVFASLASHGMTKPLALPLGHLDTARSAADSLAEQAERETSALYQARASELRRYALLLSRDEELARDALQEAFMRYFVARSRGTRIINARAWVYRVMRNYLLDRMKACPASHQHGIEELSSLSDARQDVEAAYYRRELLVLIEATLTPRELACIRLRSTGLRYEEIAASLSVRSGTVGALISRAMRKLRLAIGGMERAPCPRRSAR
ncbi:MAG: RNA polymerase sigma factor [Vicinamibacteraceae bacterium]